MILRGAAMALKQIVYFARTAEHMNMARAARELMIAQPSLSMSLSKLEDELGVKFAVTSSKIEFNGKKTAITVRSARATGQLEVQFLKKR